MMEPWKRAEANDADVLDKWFEKLADLYETSNLTDYDVAERIWIVTKQDSVLP